MLNVCFVVVFGLVDRKYEYVQLKPDVYIRCAKKHNTFFF